MAEHEEFNLLKIQVKKLLQKIEGVYSVSVDAEQQKVTVSGNVEPTALIEKLARSRKHAELCAPQKSVIAPQLQEKDRGIGSSVESWSSDDEDLGDGDLDDDDDGGEEEEKELDRVEDEKMKQSTTPPEKGEDAAEAAAVLSKKNADSKDGGGGNAGGGKEGGLHRPAQYQQAFHQTPLGYPAAAMDGGSRYMQPPPMIYYSKSPHISPHCYAAGCCHRPCPYHQAPYPGHRQPAIGDHFLDDSPSSCAIL